MIRLSLSLLALAFAAGCQSSTPSRSLSIEEIDAPTFGRAGQVFVSALPSGGHVVSWIEDADEGTVLKAAVRHEGTWRAPVTVVRGTDWFVNWADFPSIVPASDSVWFAHFLRRSGPGVYAYHVYAAATVDGGNTWSSPERVHDDDSDTEHGFARIVPNAMDGGSAMIVWLDGRRGAMAPSGHGHGGPMTLRAGQIDADGTTHDLGEVDRQVCDCCQTAAVRTAKGALVAYRNRTDDEIRDIYLARFDGERWDEPVPLHHDGWQIPGCPVNGPALASRGDDVAAAWFTAADDLPRVYVRHSGDGGVSFSNAVRIDDGRPLGRVDVVMPEDGIILVSWLEEIDGFAEVRLAVVDASRGAVETRVLGRTSAARISGFPRMASTAEGTLLAWIDVQDGSRETTMRTSFIRVSGGS